MNSEFEEKPYEEYINYELALTGTFFPIGQSFEHELGFDAGFFSTDSRFWQLWKLSPLTGADRELWDARKSVLDSQRAPKFIANLFVQYKRPEFLKSWGKQYHYWKWPYFRYDVDQAQLDVLCKLETRTTGNALVVYACAAFLKYQELLDYASKHLLVDNSNFVKPNSLNGHTVYTFRQAGSAGKAFSESEGDIPPINLFAELDKLLTHGEVFESNSEFIHVIAIIINKLLKELPVGFRTLYDLARNIIVLADHPLANDLVTVLTFARIAGVSWNIYLGKRVERQSDP